MIALLLMLACASPDYADGYDAACEFVQAGAEQTALEDAAACNPSPATQECFHPDPSSEYGAGWLDGCGECFAATYEVVKAEAWDCEG